MTRLWFAGTVAADPPWQPALTAPADVAPLRVTVSEVLPDLEPDPPCARVGAAWFADDEHLGRFDAWAGTDADGSLAAETVVVPAPAGWAVAGPTPDPASSTWHWPDATRT